MAKVLISNLSDDRNLVKKMLSRLSHYNLDAYHDELKNEDGLHLTRIISELKPTDSWVIILSKLVNDSISFLNELNINVQNELRSRDISIIPILISGQKIPKILKGRVVFKISKEPDSELHKIVRYIRNLANVNFKEFNNQSFTDLVIALLKKMRFQDIQPLNKYGLKAKTIYRDPFGNRHDVNWIIEVNFHEQANANVQNLSKLNHYPQKETDHNSILITNIPMASEADALLDVKDLQKQTRLPLIDGIRLRELILKHDDMVEKYFGLGQQWLKSQK